MDLDSQGVSKGPLKPTFEDFMDEKRGLEDGDGIRSKTSLRMYYEAQVSVIKKQLGDLEKVRADLGLSQRKICQLLMVDPSAWTRWNRPDEGAPPHIWRALQWYMILQEKIPGLTAPYFIGKDPQILHEKTLSKIQEEKAQREILEGELRNLKEAFQIQEKKLTKNLQFYRNFSLVLGGFVVFLGALIAKLIL